MRLLAALVLFGAFLPGQTPDSRHLTAAGTVTDALSGQPVPGADVDLAASHAGFGFRERPVSGLLPPPGAEHAITDEFGRFSFDLDPSTSVLALWISHPGFRSEDNQQSVRLALRPAGSVNIAVRLMPSGGIKGRAADPGGQPVAGVSVSAARIQVYDGLRRSQPDYARAMTDESGDYSLTDLPPGLYYLRIAGQTYGPVYYPAASSPDAAQLLRVEPGRAARADFQIESHPAYRISGRVKNIPLRRRLAVRLLRGDDPLDNRATVNPDTGVFEVRDVTPGSYVVQAFTPGLIPAFVGEAAVTASDSDVAGINIALDPGADVSGHIQFNGAHIPEPFAIVHAKRLDSRPLPVTQPELSTTPAADGSFAFKNLQPGRYEISVTGYPDCYLARVTAGATDVLEEGLTVPAGGVRNLRITMQGRAGQIQGAIEGASPGRPFVVALMRKYGTARIPAVVRTVQGRFRAAGLAPGQYTLYAWPESAQIEYRNPWTLSGLEEFAVPVPLGEGEVETVALKPVPTQPLQ